MAPMRIAFLASVGALPLAFQLSCAHPQYPGMHAISGSPDEYYTIDLADAKEELDVELTTEREPPNDWIAVRTRRLYLSSDKIPPNHDCSRPYLARYRIKPKEGYYIAEYPWRYLIRSGASSAVVQKHGYSVLAQLGVTCSRMLPLRRRVLIEVVITQVRD